MDLEPELWNRIGSGTGAWGSGKEPDPKFTEWGGEPEEIRNPKGLEAVRGSGGGSGGRKRSGVRKGFGTGALELEWIRNQKLGLKEGTKPKFQNWGGGTRDGFDSESHVEPVRDVKVEL